MGKKNIIEEKSFAFALKIIRLSRSLQKGRETVIANQLLKSGTSIGANVSEAIAAASRKDFIAKMTIALKEAHESRYWIRLLKESKIVSDDVSEEATDVSEIIAILTSIIKTSREPGFARNVEWRIKNYE